MYEKIEGGSIIEIQGLQCNLPPEGYVYNVLTKQLEQREIYKRSDVEADQYWERLKMPAWYAETMKRWDEFEKKKKDDDSDFYDEKLEAYKKQEWDRRLNGFWFMNNGKPVYLTGMYYFYLQWWSIDIGYPKFRLPDLEKFYFLQYCIDDPECMGTLEVTKRRFGKSFVAGLFVTEYITRTKMTNGGIQSKTGGDAKKFFAKTVVNPFRRLPRFFRPEYDMSLGVNPKTEMRFQKTNVRGKKAEESIDKDELGSVIDWQSADTVAYDGQKLARIINDEIGKCFAKGTKIRMFDGSIKNVEDIENGEYVMGDDSSSRLVYGCTNGSEIMYEIIPNKGQSFICNESHILSLSVSEKMRFKNIKYNTGDIITMSVKEYFTDLKPCYRRSLALYRKGWELNETKHLIDPYMLGVWLGDGNSKEFSITSVDNEIISSVNDFANKHNLFVRKKDDGISYHVTSKKNGVNHITKELKRLGIFKTNFSATTGTKRIPKEYLIDSRENRLKLLAGLLDTDGYANIKNGNISNFEITQKRKELSYDIQELATSLGFYSSINAKLASMKRSDGTYYYCEVYRVNIYGDLDLIPIKVERKKGLISASKNRRNPLKTGFIIKNVGIGEYYGFAVDKNHLFLLSDGTVVHNTSEVNVYDRHEVLRYCMLDDEGKIIGKALYTTTVEKLATEKNGIQDAFKLLWDESNQNNRQANGRTASGLYRFFMSAKRTRNFDIYGFPNIELTESQILADRETVKNNPRALSARIRKEPLTIEEAFSTDADGCIFNVINIANREQQLLAKPPIIREVWFYRDIDQVVRWRNISENEKDFHWKITQFPPQGNENKFKLDVKMRTPARTDDGAIAIDGYSNSQGGKFGSKASAWIGRRYNPLDPQNTGKAIGHLYGRPSVKDTLHEQVLLAAEFYGYQATYEHNSDDFWSYFRDRGRMNYLGSYPKSVIDPTKLSTTERHKGFPTTPFSLTKQTDAGIMYFEHHIESIDYLVLLEDAKKFDPNDRNDYDITVSFLMLIVLLMEPAPVKKKIEPLVKSYVPNLVN